jgi:AraC-like DNA-binding protein/mannose-6-phosphate isomerase-like protein (cupin superfamily)
MEVLHRYDSDERQHYLIQQRYSLKIKPRLMYAGKLEKSDAWQESDHSHDFCEVMYVVDGKGYITVDGLRCLVQSGDVIIYNAGLVHAEESSKDAPMEVYFMALSGLKLSELPENHLLPPGLEIIRTTGEYAASFTAFFDRMILEFERKSPFYAEITQNLALTLLMYILRIIDVQNASTTRLLQQNQSVEAAITYIRENLAEDLTLELVAKQCHLSKYYLAHLFSQYQGTSIGKYIQQCRLQEAMRLLTETPLTVKEVAERIGIQDLSYFCRIFKKETQLTPLQYRKKY